VLSDRDSSSLVRVVVSSWAVCSGSRRGSGVVSSGTGVQVPVRSG
jgi:hypothetical protein